MQTILSLLNFTVQFYKATLLFIKMRCISDMSTLPNVSAVSRLVSKNQKANKLQYLPYVYPSIHPFIYVCTLFVTFL